MVFGLISRDAEGGGRSGPSSPFAFLGLNGSQQSRNRAMQYGGADNVDAQASVNEVLQRQEGVIGATQWRLVQICVAEHTGPNIVSHLHIKTHYRHRSNRQQLQMAWDAVYSASVEDVRRALARSGRASVNVHVHDAIIDEDEDVVTRGLTADMLDAMPALKLPQKGVDCLSADGGDAVCCICLEAFVAGDDVMVFPCPGTHLAHSQCSSKWLEKACTCPTCRFALPVEMPSARTLNSLLEPARGEASRIGQGAPTELCQPVSQDGDDDAVDTEATELAELRAMLGSGRPSARTRTAVGTAYGAMVHGERHVPTSSAAVAPTASAQRGWLRVPSRANLRHSRLWGRPASEWLRRE